ncbi:PhoH family protein [Balneatrix alpica]|uniref:PhoH family protein n=1 Tax=Balneatrix alpica TaxID=75684 RepID=A0ABV5ZA91_9GAMM|nr:PhoH family protein [Balneatrix alpica]
MAASRLYVLDTNVILHDPQCLYNFEEQDVCIPMTVLEELDDIKDRKKNVAVEARTAIHAIDDIVRTAKAGQITKGVPIPSLSSQKHLGKLMIFPDHELADRKGFLPNGRQVKDNSIINCALHLQSTLSNREVVLVTKDINMRLKALGAGLNRVEDYRKDQLVSDVELLPEGHRMLSGRFWDSVEQVKTDRQGHSIYHYVDASLLPGVYMNEYVYDEAKEFAARVVGITDKQVTLLDLNLEKLMEHSCWGISPINLAQAFTMQAMLDPNLDLVIINGAAGSGKTLMALACSLDMVIEQGRYNKIVVTRSTPPVAEDIGFLPGTEEEKMTPWLSSIFDNLEAMHEGDDQPQSSVRYAIEKANIQFKSLNFIRGRSIQDAIVLIDEAQNLTPSQMKTILTRCGKGSKMVVLGNLAQIDSNYLTPLTSGLTYIVERFKNFEGSTNIHLTGVVRSRLAEYAEQNL